MKFIQDFFAGMKVVDWFLAVIFTALVAYAVNLIFPTQGWMIGIALALLLLFIAKKRRDRLTGGK